MPHNKNLKIELLASVWIMLPYIVVLNLLIFGYCIFNSLALFGTSFYYSGVYLALVYFVFRMVTMYMRK